MTGKEKCNLLRQIRKEIAESNGIVYLTSECTYSGDCKGTCPKCDAEIRYLDAEIQRLASEGKAISLSGLSLKTFETAIADSTHTSHAIQPIDLNKEPIPTPGSINPVDDSAKEGMINWFMIEELDLSVRAYNCLKRAGINIVPEICERTAHEMGKIRNLGSKSLCEVYQRLKKENLSFREEEFSLDRLQRIIHGFIAGDALGVPVEFESRESLKEKPVVGYREYGTHHMPKGTWSDDTSMTLATLDSLSHGFDYEDIMQKFCAWIDRAEYTATAEVFDIGNSTSEALKRYKNGTSALTSGCSGESDNGNGSLMRILPMAIYVKYKMPKASLKDRLDIIHKCSSLTHAHLRSQMACGIYAYLIMKLLDYPAKGLIPEFLNEALDYYAEEPQFAGELQHFQRLRNNELSSLTEDSILSSGYVVHTLEAAIWAVIKGTSFDEAVLKAVNLGNDTDTVAAVAGSIAACVYDVPEETVKPLLKINYIDSLCRNFYDAPDYESDLNTDVFDFDDLDLGDLDITGMLEAIEEPAEDKQKILDMTIQEMGLGYRATSGLTRAGIKNVKELLSVSDEDLRYKMHLSLKYIDEIDKCLSDLGLTRNEKE